MDQTRLRPASPCIDEIPPQDLVPCFRHIWDILASGGPAAGLRASAGLYTRLTELAAGPAASPQQDALVSALLAAPQSVTAMARHMGMSPYHFSRRFKASLGMGPWQYLTLLRMAKAKQLLTDTDWPVKRIARELGYSDPDYFSRLFRREVGCTARSFRAHGMRGSPH